MDENIGWGDMDLYHRLIPYPHVGRNPVLGYHLAWTMAKPTLEVWEMIGTFSLGGLRGCH